MGIEPADYIEADYVSNAGYEHARKGYPLPPHPNKEFKRGWEAFHEKRKEDCMKSGIPFREPVRA